VGEPDEEALKKLHDELATRFTAPERRVVSYLDISPSVAMRNIQVTEEQLRENYQNRIDEFREPRKRIVQQIRLADETTARKAAEALASGKSFEDVAGEFGTGDGTALEFGRFADGEFPIPEVAGAIDSLDVGGVSAPVETAFGWHIFRLAGFQEERIQPFEEVRSEIETTLKNEKAGDVLYQLSTSVQDAIAGGATLELAAQTASLEVHKAGPIDINGMDASGDRVTGLPQGDFLQIAFAADAGATSQMTPSKDGGYFILRVDEVTPSAVRPLAEVRDEVVAAWKKDKRKSAAQERALAIVQRIENGIALKTIADEEGLTLSESKPFDRRGQGAETPLVTPALVSDIFKVKMGQAAMDESPDGYTVAQLKEIVPADAAEAEGLAKTLGDSMTSDVIVQFNNALRDRFDVEVDQSALTRLF